ncbi:MAG: insulinase family protein [Acidobacteria bacterium]|nr:insulinase family protein [Acidobacteriota bacterium]MBK8147797.1 insulinase family protein [Acidobacteriota bacterium]MBK8812081.1 insulinase family protein [Acidobacteriota bacterium]
MKTFWKRGFVLATVFALAAIAVPAQPKPAGGLSVPVTYYRLPNGLRVVLSPEKSAPLVTVAVYYNIGFRIEPKDRTGFAHLFEHLMFQGSKNLGKMEYIKLVENNGGVLNGSTRFDFTNYFAVVPSHKLETLLWAEADRMRGLDITDENLKNQQGVVSNEVIVNVLNQPYGTFPWIDLPMAAFQNWYNSHNFYGELKDIEAATLGDSKTFFDKYYSPKNAVLVVVGDFDEPEAKQFVSKYFANIPAQAPDALPDISEPRQEAERTVSRTDKLANKPAVAFGYQMPKRGTPEYFAMGLIDQIMLQGEDSLIHQEFVKKKGYAGGVGGGINAYLGNMFNYNGPMLFAMDMIHDDKYTADEIKASLDEVVRQLQTQPVAQKDIDRAIVKLRSGLYDTLQQFGGFGRADLLASFALFDDRPQNINQIEANFRKVTPALIQKTAREYLRSTNRTVVIVNPETKGGKND